MGNSKRDSQLTRRQLLAALSTATGVVASGCLNNGTGSDDTVNRYVVPDLAWNFETDGDILGGVSLHDGVAYFGSYDGRVYAVEEDERRSDADDGYTNISDNEAPTGEVSKKWSFPTEGRIMSTPVAEGGDVFFGSEDNYIYSVSAESGEENWSIDTEHMVGGSSPTVVGDTVYFASGHSVDNMDEVSASDSSGVVYAVDREDGEMIWVTEMDEGVQSPPSVDGGSVYIGCQNGSFYSLDADSGETEWEFEADDYFCASKPEIYDDVLYVGCEDNNLYALDTGGGESVWEFETNDIIVSSPFVTEEAVYIGSHDRNLYAVDRQSGEEIWSFETNGSIFSSPVYEDGIVYVGSTDGNVYAVDGETGFGIWKYETERGINSSPAVTGDLIYIGSNDNNVYAIQNREVDEETYQEYRGEIDSPSEDGIEDLNDTDSIEDAVLEDVDEDEREALEGDDEVESPPEPDSPE